MLTYMKHCYHESLEVIWARKPSTIGEIKEVVSLPEPEARWVLSMVKPGVPDTGAIRLATVEEENGALGWKLSPKLGAVVIIGAPGLLVIKSHKRQLC